jgi:Ca2+-binding RTX toxin-like protein
VLGSAGDDLVFGWGEEDGQVVDDGVDEINGGHSRDVVEGGGADIILGGVQDDLVVTKTPEITPQLMNGGPQNDTVIGSDGDDQLFGDIGRDTITGGLGDDSIYGDEADDSLFGGKGADALDGGDGADLCDGGEQGDSGSPSCESALDVP